MIEFSPPGPAPERSRFAAGVRRALPLCLAVSAYGLVFGLLARQAGLSPLEVLLMSGLVYAGSSQFVALGLWSQPLPLAGIALTALVVNLRYLLMAAALRPWLDGLGRIKAYGSAFFLVDENFALTAAGAGGGGSRADFFLGSGLILYLFWLASTLAGRLAGGLVPDPARWGLDFAFSAAFLALLIGLWRGKSDLLPWLVAAGVSILAAKLLPGKWHILLGGLAGSLIGAARGR